MVVGTVLKYALTYFIGFTSGVIYTSNKYEKNPNEIFSQWGNNVKSVTESAKDTVVETANKVKEKFNKDDNLEKVEGEVVEATPIQQ